MPGIIPIDTDEAEAAVKLSRIDLNLLVALDALLAEQSVTQAAERGVGVAPRDHGFDAQPRIGGGHRDRPVRTGREQRARVLQFAQRPDSVQVVALHLHGDDVVHRIGEPQHGGEVGHHIQLMESGYVIGIDELGVGDVEDRAVAVPLAHGRDGVEGLPHGAVRRRVQFGVQAA
jgi:hypothetical protein